MNSMHAANLHNWDNLSIFAQMGNIGSEVGRAAKAHLSGDSVSKNAAIKRALDLFDLTIQNLAKTKSHRLKEVLLAREEFTRQYFSDSQYIDPSLEQYFFAFAVADRLHR